jgi:hypothetical protein
MRWWKGIKAQKPSIIKLRRLLKEKISMEFKLDLRLKKWRQKDFTVS